jgi:hypothetical protein
MSEKEKRELMLKEELDKIIVATQDYCWDALEEELEPQAVDAVRQAAQELAYKRKYYDVMKDAIVYFPSITRLLMTNNLQEKADRYYYEEEDEFPPEYSKAFKTVCREKGFVKAEDSAENDDYMEKLGQDVDLS